MKSFHLRKLAPAAALACTSLALTAQSAAFFGSSRAESYCLRTVADPSYAVSEFGGVHVMNSKIRITDRNMNFRGFRYLDFNPALGSSVNTFFDGLGATRIVQSKVVYDARNQHFYVVSMHRDPSGGGNPGIYVAASFDNNPQPTGSQAFLDWRKYRTALPNVSAIGNFTPVIGFNGLGLDDNRLVYSGIIFEDTGTALVVRGHLMRSFTYTSLNDTQPLQFTDVITPFVGRSDFELAQPAQVFPVDPANPNPGYDSAVTYSAGATNFGALRIGALQANGAFVETNVTVDPYVLPGGGTGTPIGAPQPGGGNLDPSDGRIANAVVRNGRLWTCHTVFTNLRNLVRWYEIDLRGFPTSGLNPIRVQQGVIDPGPGFHTFYPAVMADNYGNVGMVFGRSGNSGNVFEDRPSIWATGSIRNSTGGTTVPPIRITNLTGNATNFNPGGLEPWGNWFDIAFDPIESFRQFYVAGTVTKNSGIFSYCVPPPNGVTFETVLGRFQLRDTGAITAFGGPGTTGNLPAVPAHGPIGAGVPFQTGVVSTTIDNPGGLSTLGVWILGDAGVAAGIPVPGFGGATYVAGNTTLITIILDPITGAVTPPLDIPFTPDPSLINTNVFSQVVLFDAGFVDAFSNAIQIRIGM